MGLRSPFRRSRFRETIDLASRKDVDLDVTAFAALAGNALVGAAMTDAWQSFRNKFVRLFGRGDAGRTQIAERRLDKLHRQLAVAVAGEMEHAMAVHAAAWATRIADFLE